MNTDSELKNIIREKYGKIADNNKNGCGCSCSCNSDNNETVNISEDYNRIEGYAPEADLGLGCGLPTQYALIKKSDTVVDLGSGAGNDAFICAKLVGDSGKVIGIDMTEEMIIKAKQNAEKLNYKNIEFKYGDIENLPLENNIADVVVSNCVLNLVPDKQKAFSEIFRILKYGGHFCISDMVLKKELPPAMRKDVELYVGCVSGALLYNDYIKIIKSTGFNNVRIEKEKIIPLSVDTISKYIKNKKNYQDVDLKNTVLSITVTGVK